MLDIRATAPFMLRSPLAYDFALLLFRPRSANGQATSQCATVSNSVSRHGPTARYITHMFAMRCRENGIEHRFTKRSNAPRRPSAYDRPHILNMFQFVTIGSARAPSPPRMIESSASAMRLR